MGRKRDKGERKRRVDSQRKVSRREGFVDLPGGRRVAVRALGMRDLATLQESALRHYRKAFLRRASEALEEFREIRGDAWWEAELDKVMTEARALEVSDLPTMVVAMAGPNKTLVDKQVDYVTYYVSSTMEGREESLTLAIRAADANISVDECRGMFEQVLDEIGEKAYDRILDQAGNQLGEISASDLEFVDESDGSDGEGESGN